MSQKLVSFLNFEIIKFNVIPERRFDYSRIEWASDSETDEVA